MDNHHFYHITREEIENAVEHIKKKSEKRNMIQSLISGFCFERFFVYMKDLYETRVVREVGLMLFDSVALIMPTSSEGKSVDSVPFAVDTGSEEDVQPPSEIHLETLTTFLKSEKTALVRTEIMDSLQSNGLPNILETPEIILNYLECQTMSSLSPTRLLDAVFEVISTYRNRKIL